MEFNFKISKSNTESVFAKFALHQTNPCELQVKLDLNDLLMLLLNDKQFRELHDKSMKPIYYKMEKLEGNELLITISGDLSEGFKAYKCVNCQTINILKNNNEIRVGFCYNCQHPLWND